MRKKLQTSFLPVLFFLACATAFLQTAPGKTVAGFFDSVFVPLQKSFVTTFHIPEKNTDALREENSRLTVQLVNQQKLLAENKALRDQFAATGTEQKKLLPAFILGMRTAADTFPAYIVLDKGETDGVRKNLTVLYQDYLIGKIVRVSAHRSVAETLYSQNVRIPSLAQQTQALGITSYQNGSIVLEHVVLSEKLTVGDIVVTKGSLNENDEGYVPGVILGTVKTVHKKTSELFQSAEITNALAMNKLSTVFIYLPNDN